MLLAPVLKLTIQMSPCIRKAFCILIGMGTVSVGTAQEIQVALQDWDILVLGTKGIGYCLWTYFFNTWMTLNF